MTQQWVVRLLGDDGTAVEGRLDIGAEQLEFRAGTKGSLVPAVVIRRDGIASVEQVDHGLGHRVELTLTDGRRLTFDHGLRPTADLVAALSRRR